MSKALWCFLQLLSIISTSNVINSYELAVSSKSDIVVFNDKTEMKRISLPNSILSVGSNFQDHLIVVQPGVNESQMKVTTFQDVSISSNETSHYVSMIPGISKVLPDPVKGHLFFSNQSQLILQQESNQVIFHGQKIQDLAIDFCQRSLFVVDNGKLFHSNLDQLNIKAFLPSENDALQVSKDFYLAQNLAIGHSDGFIIKKLADGRRICHSNPSKQYNIRDMILIGNDLFLLDALNSVIWSLQVDKTSETCDLNPWKYVRKLGQLMNLVPLKIGTIDCISPMNNTDQYYGMTATSTSPLTTKIHPEIQDDPCHNFCFHGKCSSTSLNKPICHCEQNYTGTRCETNTCHNFCLNGGSCNISSFREAICLCPPESSGSRCEILKVTFKNQEDQLSWLFFYEIAFYVSTILCIFCVFILLFLCIMYVRTRKNDVKEPEIVTKTNRTRVFSTSSNSGKRSRSASRPRTKPKPNGSVNEGFGNETSDDCVDDKGHMCQALISDDGVVLDLEDCCNMTVCEKPCIEASFRKPTNRKKQHQHQRLVSQDELF